jgi:hypothetical protein
VSSCAACLLGVGVGACENRYSLLGVHLLARCLRGIVGWSHSHHPNLNKTTNQQIKDSASLVEQPQHHRRQRTAAAAAHTTSTHSTTSTACNNKNAAAAPVAGNKATQRIPVYPDHPLSQRVVNNDNADHRENDRNATAGCHFRVSKRSTNHFPRAMHQLYQCWSYWQSQKQKRPVQLLCPDAKGFRSHHRGRRTLWDWIRVVTRRDWGSFSDGFALALQEAANVTILVPSPSSLDDDDNNQIRASRLPLAVERADRAETYYLQSPTRVDALRDAIAQHYRMTQSSAGSGINSRGAARGGGAAAGEAGPKIANRRPQSSRSVPF